jgi:hypothetical protein
VVFTLTRPGTAAPDGFDRIWHDRLREAAAAHHARVRMTCLATPEGVLALDGV